MKRLLSVILILGISTTANAVLITTEGERGQALEFIRGYTISVIGEDTSNWLGYIIIEEGGSGELSNPVVLDAAADQASAVAYTEAGWGAGFELIQDGYPRAAPGPQFSFDYSYSGDLAADTTISLYIDPYYEVPVAQLIIPEPITVVLLGLGGLFLRRRK